MKQSLTSDAVMTYFDPYKFTEMVVDASPVGLAGAPPGILGPMKKKNIYIFLHLHYITFMHLADAFQRSFLLVFQFWGAPVSWEPFESSSLSPLHGAPGVLGPCWNREVAHMN